MLTTLATNLGISAPHTSNSPSPSPSPSRHKSRIPTRSSSYIRGAGPVYTYTRGSYRDIGVDRCDRGVSRGRQRGVGTGDRGGHRDGDRDGHSDKDRDMERDRDMRREGMVDGATQTGSEILKAEGIRSGREDRMKKIEKNERTILPSGIPTCGSCAGTGVDRDFNPQIHLSPASAAHHAASTHTPIQIWTPSKTSTAASAAALLAHSSHSPSRNPHHDANSITNLNDDNNWPLKSALHAHHHHGPQHHHHHHHQQGQNQHIHPNRRRRADSEPPTTTTRKRDSGFISGPDDEVSKDDILSAATAALRNANARPSTGDLQPPEIRGRTKRNYHGDIHEAARQQAEARLMRIGYSVTGPGMEEMELREEKRKKGVQAQLLLAQARKNVEESMQRQDREIADRGIRREILIDEQQNGRGQRRLRSSSSDPSLRRGGFGGRRDRDRESLKGGHIDIGGGGKIDQRRLEMIAAEKVRENLRDIDEKAAELEWQRRRIFEEKERRQMMRVREKELRRQRKRERKENKRREKLMSDGSSLSSMSSISSISESSIGSKKGKKLGLFRRGSRKSPLRNSSSMSSLSSDHEPEILEPNTPRNRRFSSDDATSTHRKSTFLSLLFGRNRHKSPHRKPILSSPETQQTHKSSTNTPHRGSIGSIFFDHHTSQKPAKEADPSLAIEAANDPIQPLPIPALSDSRRSTDSSRSSHYHDTHETPQTLDTLPEVDEAGTNGQNEIIVETITETRKSTTDSSGKVIESETVIERDLDVLDLPEFAKLPEFGGEERVRERRERRGKVGKSVGFVEGDVLDVDTTSSTDSTDSTDSDSEEVLDETHQQEDKENNPLGLPEFEKKPKPNPKKKTHKSKGKGKGKAPAIASSSNEAFQSTVPISSKNHEQYEQYSQYGQYTVGHGGAKPVMKDPVGSNPVVPKPVDLSTVYMGLPEFAGKSSTPIKDTGTGASAGTSGYLDLPEFGGGSGGVRDKGKGKEKEVVETPPVQVADEKSNFLTLPEFGGREKSSFDSGRESRFTEGL